MKLSVISIAYNNLNGLRKTLELFEDGRYSSDIELVVVDGGSADGTKAYLENSKFINKWVSEPDKGIYNAMNKGLSMASGEYVWFLNSGDYAISHAAVNELLTALKNGPDAVFAETMMVDENGKHLGTRSAITTRKLPEHLNWQSFKLGMNVGHQSFVIKRQLALTYNEQFRYVADIDWMIRCLKICHTVIKLNAVLACFTMDGFSSKNRDKSNKERFKVLASHYGYIPNLFNHAQIVFRKWMNKGKV